jgi:hypothetical protein
MYKTVENYKDEIQSNQVDDLKRAIAKKMLNKRTL